ncbi:lytic murein transglycosylase B [Oleiphilus sp. HI0071]|uniref:lytic murein transglycosylase B n=2 Tax=Oleiphilus TaxID=141450 RepID=UPI0007C3AE2E|nr:MULTISPECIES: lytic murein transglycosylase B [unclassified Oleiphilus]KZY71107.1 lytic murein transglycosylase B [Oleiphilus sp. HI0065]KZY81630.1 lytic murein transglycosylase B [Oleiphilus sp. HI0071]KZZ03785.1 lytic murein transglycosylase B [Oleiphilus sp. HI0073]KZZ52215.1 lytic murein transglycosylase B [Oleiphilus sp. HI0122]KZZ66752.1 lytic murein transglycosylase B [Oleiphilus sp. HI0130]KZZ82379.1 lytic murein transglycosylase B [Oleiphilus sp. HI0133]
MKFVGLLVLMVFASGVVRADYSEHPLAQSFIDKMVNEHGFEEGFLRDTLKQAERKESILKAISRPAEKRLNWAEYSKIFLTEKRIRFGKEFMLKYAAVLERAESEFGVPKEIITAIIGVETRYGQNKGSYRVLDALTTLGFDYEPRGKFFTKELTQMFLLAREQGFNVADLKGSYAGAMGYGQFISSSYRHYAVDFDGDGVVDILNNPVDAIGSVANYFKEHRWHEGKPVAERADLSDLDYQGLLNKSLKPKYQMADLRAKGLLGFEEVPDDAAVKILDLQGDEGQETWLAWHNFYVITRYNHSHLYAMAVYQLSKEIFEAR